MALSQPLLSKWSSATVLGSSPHEDICGLPYQLGALISLWLFPFAAEQNEFFLDWLKKLEQRSHKCVELRGEYAE
jgi:hypothetical protein